MKNIIIAVLIFSGIVIFASYSGIVKINAPENLFGKADKISSDGFQFVEKINLLDNQQVFSATFKKTNSSQLVKATNIISIISPIVSSSSSSTALVVPEALIIPTFIASSTLSTSIASTTTISTVASQVFPNIINIGISEILVGIDGGTNYEFIELYNPNNVAIDLTSYSIKKRSSTDSESTLVSASRFEGKKIMPKKYFLLANEGGYNGAVQPDIVWPKSYTLAYKNNAIIFYNANGEAIEDIGWDEIVKGQSLERVSTPWSSGEFKIQNNPNPQNSQSN